MVCFSAMLSCHSSKEWYMICILISLVVSSFFLCRAHTLNANCFSMRSSEQYARRSFIYLNVAFTQRTMYVFPLFVVEKLFGMYCYLFPSFDFIPFLLFICVLLHLVFDSTLFSWQLTTEDDIHYIALKKVASFRTNVRNEKLFIWMKSLTVFN